MAARRTNTNRRGSRKKAGGGIPAWFWLLGGIVIGLGIAVALMFRGYLPEFKEHSPVADKPVKNAASKALISEKKEPAEPEKPRFDFFTVLPEMEVVVPEQELQRQAKSKPEPVASTNTSPNENTGGSPNTSSPATTTQADRYILQVGSFQSSAEAEQMKAQLAMIGFSANIQTVTVNGQSWHRVRVGPFEGAREAEEMRRMLTDNQFQPLVMKAKS
jgi:cell division protein FtsN